MEHKSKSLKSSGMLLLAAFVWGVAFVAQSEGMKHVGAFTFIAVRFFIGGIVLIPLVLWRKKENEKKKTKLKTILLGGICCGVFLFLGSTLQQYGMLWTTVGKAGFITSLYIIIVPLLGLLLGKKVGLNLWISVILAAMGMYLLCITENFQMSTGDFLVLICAFAFSFHILVIDYFSDKVDGVLLSCIQFFVVAILGSIGMFLFEEPRVEQIFAASMPILYAGVMSSGVGYTLQILAQKNVEPTIAALIMSMESVFAMLAGWLLLGEIMSTKEFIGCFLVFIGIILAQLPEKRKKRIILEN